MKKHLIYLLLILIIMAGSAMVNKLPAGHVVAGSDFPYILDVENHMNDTMFVWSNMGIGQGSPDRPISVVFRYITSFTLKLFGLNDTQVLSANFFIFIFLAAVSAYLAMGILTKFRTRPLIYFIVAIFYSFNSFTLYGFTASWMYHPIFDVYIFLPLICVLFLKGLLDNNKRYLVISIIIFLISLSGFSNPAFLVALLIFLFLLVLMLVLLGHLNKRALLTALVVFSLYLSVIAFYIVPISIEYLFGTTFNFVADGAVNVVKIASSKVINSWRLMNDNPALFFPNNFPYLQALKPYYSFLSIYPAILMVLSLLFVKEKNKKIVLTFGAALIVFTYIAVKINFPYFQNTTLSLFSLPILNGLRAADKTYPFIAFISAVLLFYFLESVSGIKNSSRIKKLDNYLLIGCLAVIILFAFPFFVGKFQQTMTMDNKQLPISHLVKIPQAYRELAKYIDRRDKSTYKLLHMPYGGVPNGFEATKWSYYPKWKFLGSDITRYLFNQPVINPTDPIGNFNYGKYFHENPKMDVFTNMFRLVSARYLIVDKNVDPAYYRSFKKMFIENDTKSNFKLLKRFKNLELYRINSDIELPQIYSSSSEGPMLVIGDSDAIPIILDELNSKPAFFLSKSSTISEKPLNLLKSADTVIFSEGDVMDLALDLLPKNMGDINGLRLAINEKANPIYVPFSGSFEVFAKVEKDQNNFRRDYLKLDQMMLEKNIRYSDRPIFGKNLVGRIKEGRWRYKGAIQLSKGNHTLDSSQKVQEVIIIPKENFKKHIASIQKILTNKPTGFFVRKKANDKYFLEMSNKKNLPKRRQSGVKFSKINPTKYIVKLDSKKPNWLIFSESFNKGWKAYYGRVNWWQALWQKPVPEDKHFLVNGYANAWHIDKSRSREITLYFWPQTLFYICLIISGLTLFGCIGYLGRDLRKRNINNLRPDDS